MKSQRADFVFIALIVVCLLSGPILSQGWRKVSITLRRTISSANVAAEYLNGFSPKLLSAYELVQTSTGASWDMYRVFFMAKFLNEMVKKCDAEVLWTFEPTFKRTVYFASCELIPLHQQEENDPTL